VRHWFSLLCAFLAASALGYAPVPRDWTFACPGQGLFNDTNAFTVIAQSAGLLGTATNVTVAHLPTPITVAYDLNGNLTFDGLRSFAYDSESQLTNVNVAGQWRSEFVFDGLGRKRIERDYTWTGSTWQQTNEVRFVYDGMLVLQERDADNTPLVTYTRRLDLSGSRQVAGGIGGLLARTDANGTAYYRSDGAGNVTALMDAQQHIVARYLYDPFGRQLGQWGELAAANRYRFSSKEVHLQSGLYYYGFRHYDPNLQRWLSGDPLGEAGGINLYGFVGNSPLNLVDPFGLEITYFYGRQEPSILFPDGSVPYLTGDNFGENLVASFYNAIPLANNLIEKAADPLDQGIAALTDAVANGVTAAAGYPEFGEGVRNLGAVAPFLLGKKTGPCKPAKLQLTERWYPIQVKQKDRVGRPDIDAFQTAMRRSKRDKGFFVAFDYTEDALREIDRFFKADHAVIVPLTVQEILDEQIARKLA
jgi:RHS repeat-associated protein